MSPESLKHQLECEAEDIVLEQLKECRNEVEKNIKDWLKEHEQDEAAKYDTIHKQLVDVQTQLAILMKLFEQGKGAVTILKWLGYIVAGVWAIAVWAKDHVKF